MMLSIRYLYDNYIRTHEDLNFPTVIGSEAQKSLSHSNFYGFGCIYDALCYYWRQKSVGFRF